MGTSYSADCRPLFAKMTKYRMLLAIIALALSRSVSAESLTANQTTSGAASTSGNTREAETTKIRNIHLKRLDDRLNVEPKELKGHCRYESDISIAPPSKHVVLTFDDGPEPGETEFILETLRKHGINAAFFMIGTKMQQHPELVAKVNAAGHQVIGNHSWSHPNFHDISVTEQVREIAKAEVENGGAFSSRLFRYPYGNSTCEANDYLHMHGYRIVGWHVDSCDWAFDKSGSVDVKEAISCEVSSQYRNDFVGHVVSAVRAHNGGIVLMHEIHPRTVRQLDAIISTLTADGFVFGNIADADMQPMLR